MYYFDSNFLGTLDENDVAEPIIYPAANNSGNFGLDHYEPGFAVSRESWLDARDAGTGLKNNVRLTITDTTSTADLFYFCHIHNGMSGRIKLVTGERSTTHLQAANLPALYTHSVPANFDNGCGTFGLDAYSGAKICPAQDTNKFLCAADNATTAVTNFNECLHAMDCAMHTEMRVAAHHDDPLTTFMHQMIPHHHNAVNMAKTVLKQVVLDSNNDPDGEVANLLWSIVNEQNMQITMMEGWLSDRSRLSYGDAMCNESTGASPSGTPALSDSGASSDDDDHWEATLPYAVWASIATALLIGTWVAMLFVSLKKKVDSESGSVMSGKITGI